MIDSFADPDSPYTVTRHGAGTYVGGRFVGDPSPSTFSLVATIQPHDGRTLMPLPEGYRSEDVRLVLAYTPLRTLDSGGAADEIAYKSETWTVISVDNYEAFGETHVEAIIARQPVST